jgi:hypothetical protein
MRYASWFASSRFVRLGFFALFFFATLADSHN